MRLGQVEQFFFAFHQANAGQAAGRNCYQRLNDVKTTALGIGVRIQESQYPVAAISHMKDEEIEWQQ